MGFVRCGMKLGGVVGVGFVRRRINGSLAAG